MKWHTFLAIAFSLVLGTASRADDASDCNRAMLAPDAAIPACTRMLDSASGENARKLLLLRSRAYAAKKSFDAALADAAQMAVVAPANRKSSAIMQRAYVHDTMKDYDAEIADYTELLNANPQDYTALSNRCAARSRSPRDPNEALADCNTALAQFGQQGPDITTRGLVYLRLGRFKDALADYDFAIANGMAYPQCYYGRGVAKLKLGDAEGSKADIAKGVALKSDIAEWFSPFGLTP